MSVPTTRHQIMKMHFRKIRLMALLLLFAACIGFVVPDNVKAQVRNARPKKVTPKEPTPEKKYITWEVAYTVTIKGNGEQKGEIQGDPDIKWWVNRSFVGKLRLLGPTPLRNDDKVVAGWVSFENYGSKANPPSVKVIVKDRLEKFIEGPGEMGTHDDRTTVTVWEADTTETGKSDDASALAVNADTRKYWVVLPVLQPSIKKNVRMARFTIADRSAEGYGGLPTHEVSKPLEGEIALGDIRMPRGDNLETGRSGSWILFPKSKGGQDDTLPASYPYQISFPRTCFKPTEPFFEGIEDTKTKVDICVEFSMWKVPD